MIIGILAGGLASMLWIGIHIILMHIRPAENRFQSMLSGYLISLPLVVLISLWASEWNWARNWTTGQEAWAMSLMLAYLWHLLIFFVYAEIFYLERSVTLRFLVEILQRPAGKAQLDQILTEYNVKTMILNRLEVLEDNNFIECQDGQWRLKAKGWKMAKAMRVSAWIYQSQAQPDRL